jgi:hypothetical protein
LLPEEIKIALKGRRIERTGGSLVNSEGNKTKKEKISVDKETPEKPEIDYNAILSKCGLYSHVSLNMKDIEITLIADIPYKELKDRIGGEYVDGVGIMAKIEEPQIRWILDKALRIMNFRATDHDLYERWSHKFRVNIEREMIKGSFNLSRNNIGMEAN